MTASIKKESNSQLDLISSFIKQNGMYALAKTVFIKGESYCKNSKTIRRLIKSDAKSYLQKLDCVHYRSIKQLSEKYKLISPQKDIDILHNFLIITIIEKASSSIYDFFYRKETESLELLKYLEQSWKKKKLDKKALAALKKIGIIFPYSKARWMIKFTLYKECAKEVQPIIWSTVYKEVKIGEWQRTQRKYFERLSGEQQKLLLNCGFVRNAKVNNEKNN